MIYQKELEFNRLFSWNKALITLKMKNKIAISKKKKMTSNFESSLAVSGFLDDAQFMEGAYIIIVNGLVI